MTRSILLPRFCSPSVSRLDFYLGGFGALWNQEGWKGRATSAPGAGLMRSADTSVCTCVHLVNTQKKGWGGGVSLFFF